MGSSGDKEMDTGVELPQMTVYMEFSDRVHLFFDRVHFFCKDCIICIVF